MAQHNSGEPVLSEEKVLSLCPMSIPDTGATALNLVDQVADILRAMEEQIREAEARAQVLCMRAAAAERTQREFVVAAEDKLKDACRALQQAQSYIEAQRDKLTAAELRAEIAEAEAQQAKGALARVEEAIRTCLLPAKIDAERKLTAVA